jgi:hypothetical protein
VSVYACSLFEVNFIENCIFLNCTNLFVNPVLLVLGRISRTTFLNSKYLLNYYLIAPSRNLSKIYTLNYSAGEGGGDFVRLYVLANFAKWSNGEKNDFCCT